MHVPFICRYISSSRVWITNHIYIMSFTYFKQLIIIFTLQGPNGSNHLKKLQMEDIHKVTFSYQT